MKMSEETIVVILEEKPRGNTGAVVRYEGDSEFVRRCIDALAREKLGTEGMKKNDL